MSRPLVAPVQPPSVADVARLAGVSPATVSRAFNTPLPRVRIIPIGAFDPTRYL